VVSVGIGLFIVPRTWRLISDAVGVLLEGTPADVNLAEIRDALAAISGVSDVHDLHVWALTSGVNALSVHVVADASSVADDLLARVTACARDQLHLAHVTVQVESAEWHCGDFHA
jgi:cobalt-zinc-cadmium efflux system protein